MQKRVIAKELAILATRMTWIVASRVLVFTLFGIALNAVAFFVDRYAVLAYLALSSESAMPGARAGGAGAVIVLVVMAYSFVVHNPVFFGIVLLFCVAFPLLHFLVGKKYGISAALAFAARDKQAALVGYVVERMLMAAARHPQWQQWLSEGGVAHALDRFLPPYLRRLENMPWLLRAAVKRLLGKFDFASELVRSLRASGVERTDPERISDAAAKLFETHISANMFRPSWRAFWALTGCNVLFAVLVRIGAQLLH